MKKTLKMIGITIFGVITLITLSVVLFLYLSPQFGGAATKAQKNQYAASGHYQEGKFVNRIEAPLMSVPSLDLLKDFIKDAPNRSPKKSISVQKLDSTEIVNHNSKLTKLTWFGHSAFLLQMDGKNILIDPMLGESPSPLPLFGAKRYSKDLPIAIEKLPFIDAVLISHDHYDHLDYESIQKLKHKVGEYFTPLGVGNHLVKWGIPKTKIHELNWWDTTSFQEIELVCTPARHFSGRGLTDRSATLWSSWVIKGRDKSVFFSGDSGYDTHFKEIGDKYGPFDITLMECGQYNERWKEIHMIPEETAQAALDLKSKLLMPIHWGAFTLALHDWTDPVERLSKKANELNLEVTTPKIGESIILQNTNYPKEKWWEKY